MNIQLSIFALMGAVIVPFTLQASETASATSAINTLGIELLGKIASPDHNALISPYSIQNALAMTYVGADGVTRQEMAKVLYFPATETELNASFLLLNHQLSELAQKTAKAAAASKQQGGPMEPVSLQIANRLFGQTGFEFRLPFLETLKNNYEAPLESLDFHKNAPQATEIINAWVENATHQRIRQLIPAMALTEATRLVLVNAIYLKAAWAKEFPKNNTQPASFLTQGTTKVDVPTMRLTSNFGYVKQQDYTAVTLPYIGGELQFLILLPDRPDGLAALEAKLTPDLLSSCAALESQKIVLSLPKFKLEPPTMRIGDTLKLLGMNTAFDSPQGSANFDRMAPRTPNHYLYLSQVFHKTFLSLDENGTEAAAATASVMMMSMLAAPSPNPVEVHVDHPFLFAIQHRASGACLFLGRITDPR